MADEFEDLDDLLRVEPFVLPVGGKRYEFPGDVSGRAYLLIQRASAEFDRAQKAKAAGQDYEPDTEVLSDDDELDLSAEMFGGMDQVLASDGVGSAALRHIFMTLFAYHAGGKEAALAVWRNQGEAPSPNREARRKASKGSGTSTRSPASTSGTSSRSRPSAKG